MAPRSLPRPHPSVICQRLEDGAVLFAPATETYFGLNDVGALIWELLPPSTDSLDALCRTVGARYPDVDVEQIRADVEDLLAQLVHEGLARLDTPEGAPGPRAD